MTTEPQHEFLPHVAEVETLLDEKTTIRLARSAGVPPDMVERFKTDLISAVRDYLEDARRPAQGEIRKAIDSLGRRAHAALKGNSGALESVSESLSNLPTEARQYMNDIASIGGRKFPTVSDLTDPDSAEESLLLLYGLCVSGATWKTGRRRAKGKRSRAAFEYKFVGPSSRGKGRPKDYIALAFCNRLAMIYIRMTGKPATRKAKISSGRRDRESPAVDNTGRDRGRFVGLVTEVLRVVAPKAAISADDLVRRWEAGDWDH